jgi:hypothetical protein
MQSGNRLRRDSILVELTKANLNRLRINQSGPKLFFDEFDNIFHPSLMRQSVMKIIPAPKPRTLVT